jgi:hypothetical protein
MLSDTGAANVRLSRLFSLSNRQKLDLTQHRMLHEGPLTWRISRAKQIDLHVVLLDEILLLLQRQDERLVLRCQNTTVVAGKDDTKYTHSPIIKLTNLLTRNVATGTCRVPRSSRVHQFLRVD